LPFASAIDNEDAVSTSAQLETWLLEAGASMIEKEAGRYAAALTPRERAFIACGSPTTECATPTIWIPRWTSMPIFRRRARASAKVGLAFTRAAFELPKDELPQRYFDLLDQMCEEIRAATTCAADRCAGG
jgi:hypothetical protein